LNRDARPTCSCAPVAYHALSPPAHLVPALTDVPVAILKPTTNPWQSPHSSAEFAIDLLFIPPLWTKQPELFDTMQF
jgi:hypothetical protein